MRNFSCLTEIEELGLRSVYNLSDGHAAHDLSLSERDLISKLEMLWYKAEERSIAVSEREYIDAFYQLAEDPLLQSSLNYCICTSASQSIDMFAAYCFRKKLRVALVEPTFDNLAQILRRWDIEPVSLPEDLFFTEAVEDLVKVRESFDVLFLVIPNNPSGRNLTSYQIDRIVNYCARTGKMLAVDRCFRLFYPCSEYLTRAVIDSGISFVFIEDSGKIWPTQELKASILLASSDVYKDIKEVYREINLTVSGFALDLLREFINNALTQTIEEAIWNPVSARRVTLRKSIQHLNIKIPDVCKDSRLPVDWLQFIGTKEKFDFFYKNALKSGLVILPGRFFYWKHQIAPDHYFRVALMKKSAVFTPALKVLKNCLEDSRV